MKVSGSLLSLGYVEENENAKYEKFYDFDRLFDGFCFNFTNVSTTLY